MNPSTKNSHLRIIERDGRLDYYESVFKDHEYLFDVLYQELAWRQDEITLFGKTHPIPRLQAWYGDPDAYYTYSRIKLTPLAWTPTLLKIKKICEDISGQEFQGVLCNLYRDGRDYAAWHSDNEKELGQNPTIASVSLGAKRRFQLKHMQGEREAIELESGSLVVMSGELQEFWKHQLAKTQKTCGPRINLTFRPLVY